MSATYRIPLHSSIVGCYLNPRNLQELINFREPQIRGPKFSVSGRRLRRPTGFLPIFIFKDFLRLFYGKRQILEISLRQFESSCSILTRERKKIFDILQQGCFSYSVWPDWSSWNNVQVFGSVIHRLANFLFSLIN